MPGIKTYCHIKNNKVFLDGKLLFQASESVSLKEFSVKVFRHYKFKYPKFFKMDDISKLGFLSAEILLTQNGEQLQSEDVGIVLSNTQSTLVTDANFQESINEYDNFFPSPSVFVYTLPNIMIGEISIRHKFRGENAFFIFDAFNEKFLTDYINLIFSKGKTEYCLGGWVDQSENDYEAFMYLVGPDAKGDIIADNSAEEVRKLYENI